MTRVGIHNAASGLRSGFHICHLTVSSILIGQEAWRVAFPDATLPRSGTMNSGPGHEEGEASLELLTIIGTFC